MKKIIRSILLLTVISGVLVSCSNGDYVANPASAANGSVNPLNPLKASQFTWTGTAPLSLSINGANWVADSAIYSFIDSSGTNYIEAWKGKQYIVLYMKEVYGGSVYQMGYKDYNILAEWFDIDSIFSTSSYYLSALGNSGELYVTTNDTANMAGKFYFQGANGSSNDVITVSNGYFSIKKY